MAGENDAIKSVSQLSQYTFHVPAYQRGYRWTDAEVKDLLNDIRSFSPADVPGSKNKTWYCLQPLVVRNRKDLGDQTYEIIDGQQRITTILLIGRYINEIWRGKEKDPELRLEYQSRGNTSEFLDKLRIHDDDSLCVDDSNIDFYHISVAYQTISNWMRAQMDFNRDAFISTFLHYVKVIWYEPPADAGSIEIFTRINMGKIRLTNAELIKALFLNRSNFSLPDSGALDENKIRLRQMEIAGDWDRMEAALHDSEFWYFLDNYEYMQETRIDLLFGLLTGREPGGDSYEIFRAFNESFKNRGKQTVDDKWAEVKRCFQTLEEWFRARAFYHKIGYLICTGTRLVDLLELSREKRKSDFHRLLDEKIQKTIPVGLDDLEYKDQKAVRRVLLLHNIRTMLNNAESGARFPFDRFKLEHWDVEHVHSVSEKMPSTEAHQREWLNEVALHCKDEDLKSEIKAKLEEKPWNTEVFLPFFEKILVYFSGEDDQDINDLSNLVLLDRGTNRGYGNSVFPEKRRKIIEREKQGIFVPVCTKNVFMKFYSKTIDNFTFWCQADREAYFNDMKVILLGRGK